MNIYLCYRKEEGLKPHLTTDGLGNPLPDVFGKKLKESLGTRLMSEQAIKMYIDAFPNMIYKKIIDSSSAELNASLSMEHFNEPEITEALKTLKRKND